MFLILSFLILCFITFTNAQSSSSAWEINVDANNLVYARKTPSSPWGLVCVGNFAANGHTTSQAMCLLLGYTSPVSASWTASAAPSAIGIDHFVIKSVSCGHTGVTSLNDCLVSTIVNTCQSSDKLQLVCTPGTGSTGNPKAALTSSDANSHLQNTTEESTNNVGLIVGVSVGSFVGVAMVVSVIVFVVLRRRNSDDANLADVGQPQQHSVNVNVTSNQRSLPQDYIQDDDKDITDKMNENAVPRTDLLAPPPVPPPR